MNSKKLEKRLDANDKACRYLGNANEARERGNKKAEAYWLDLAQKWLDRLNELDGLS